MWIIKQTVVLLWKNCSKYGSVSYLFSCKRGVQISKNCNAPHVEGICCICNYWSETNAMFNNWDGWYSFSYGLTLGEQLWGENCRAKKEASPKATHMVTLGCSDSNLWQLSRPKFVTAQQAEICDSSAGWLEMSKNSMQPTLAAEMADHSTLEWQSCWSPLVFWNIHFGIHFKLG